MTAFDRQSSDFFEQSRPVGSGWLGGAIQKVPARNLKTGSSGSTKSP
jgi:hypothetical protein